MAFWNSLFHYKAGSGSVGDLIHYMIARVAFSWNADTTQKAMYQNILEECNDERLALSYTYARIQQAEAQNNRQRQEEADAAKMYEAQLWKTAPKYVDMCKQEFIDEQIRWERRGLTPTEIKLKRIDNDKLTRKDWLAEPIIKTFNIFPECEILIHDKVGGKYTIEVNTAYWDFTCNPVYRWRYLGTDEQIILSFKHMDSVYPYLCIEHARYMERENDRLKRQMLRDEHNRRAALGRQILEDAERMYPTNQSQQSQVVSHKQRKQNQVDHVRAAMGQSTIDDNLIDDTIF